MKNRLGYIVIAYTSLFCYGIIDNLRGPAYPSILEMFDVSNARGSLIFTLSAFSALITIALGRRWLRLLGELVSQRVFLIIIGIGGLGMGLSGYLDDGFIALLASSTFFGLGLGGTAISTNVLVAFGSSEKNRRRVYSGLHSMYGIASVIAPVIFSIAVRAGYDWRPLIMILSVLPFLVFAMSLRTPQIPRGGDISEKPFGVKLRTRLMVGFVLSFYVAAEVAISSRLVLFIHRTFDMSAADASLYLSLFFILLLAGRFAFFVFPFPGSSFRLMLISAIISLLLFVAGIFYHPIALSLCGLTMSYYFPCGMDWISKRFGENTGFMMTSVMTSVEALLIAMHWGIGLAADKAGVKNAMLLGPAFLVLTIVFLIMARGEFKVERR